MSKILSIRVDDSIYDAIDRASKKSGANKSLLYNMLLFEGMRHPEGYRDELKLIGSSVAFTKYKQKKKKTNEMRFELDNVLKRIYQICRVNSLHKLESNMKHVVSIITEFEKAYQNYPEDIQIEQKEKFELIRSLKHQSALSEYLGRMRNIEFGEINVSARKQINQRRNK